MEISLEEFVAAIFEAMSSEKWGPSIIGDFHGKVTHLEEIAYRSFCCVRAFECSLKLEQWKLELLNAVFLNEVADYCDKNNILDRRNAERFIFDRWFYYYDAWAKGTAPDYIATELPMSLAGMLVQHKHYEKLTFDKIDADILILGAVIMNYTTSLIGEFKKQWEDVRITFNSNDAVKHDAYVIKFHEMWIEKKGFKNN